MGQALDLVGSALQTLRDSTSKTMLERRRTTMAAATSDAPLSSCDSESKPASSMLMTMLVVPDWLSVDGRGGAERRRQSQPLWRW